MSRLAKDLVEMENTLERILLDKGLDQAFVNELLEMIRQYARNYKDSWIADSYMET